MSKPSLVIQQGATPFQGKTKVIRSKSSSEEYKEFKNKVFKVMSYDASTGQQTLTQFKFQNNVNASPLQVHPRIAKLLKYQAADWYKMTIGKQERWSPWWSQPTALGDQNIPNRGIESLMDGEKSTLVADLSQAFGNRANHEFRTIIHEVEKICLKDTFFDFFCGTNITTLTEDTWFNKSIYFTKPFLEKGTRKQEYPIVTYYQEVEGGTYVSTGYGLSIPFESLFSNGAGAKGRYTIDKFIMAGFNAIALGFKDFLNVYFFELIHNMDNTHTKYLDQERKKYRDLDEYMEFNEKIWGILNPEDRVDKRYKTYPVERLIHLIENHIRHSGNHTFGQQGFKPGILLYEDIILDERYQKYNNKFCYVGPKKGTFRNVDTLDTGDDIWNTEKMGAVIFGHDKFKDDDHPTGFSPSYQMLRMGYGAKFPCYEEVYDKDHPERYSSNHHDIEGMVTKKLPITFLPIRYKDVLNYVDEEIIRKLFGEGRTFLEPLTLSFGNEDRVNTYFKDIANIIMQREWGKLSKNLSLDQVIQNVRFSLAEETHVIAQPTTNTPQKRELKELNGVMELMSLIERVLYVMKQFGLTDTLTQDNNDEKKFLIFLHIILTEEEITGVKNTRSTDNIQRMFPVVKSVFTQIRNIHTPGKNAGISSFKNVEITQWIGFKNYFMDDVNSLSDLIKIQFGKIEPHTINKEFIMKFLEYNIPLFFQTVLIRLEDVGAWCAIFGTNNMAQKKDVEPNCVTKFDEILMEASVQCRNNVGIQFIRPRDAYVAENVKIDLDNSKIRVTCNIPSPDENSEYFKVLILYKNTNLKRNKRLFFQGVQTSLRQVIEDQGYRELVRTHDFPEVEHHMSTGNWLEDEYNMENEEYEYYMKEKRIRYSKFTYMGGYKQYNPSTQRWDIYHKLNGPMSKFYDINK